MNPKMPPSSLVQRVYAVLQGNRERLRAEFVRLLHEKVGPHYEVRPLEELEETSGRAMAAYLAAVGAGDWTPMDTF
ncbi:MAG: hypothetical protein IH608_02075, partial [Proteobacteria bacterium]|nr:hypothetical protein [Pseudomonadota bacterium]